MMRRALLLLAMVSLATTAGAAWYPEFNPTYVRVEVGETRWVRVRAIWTGLMIVPWSNWFFDSTDPRIAHIDDVMVQSGGKDIAITGVAPGEAGLFVHGYASNRPRDGDHPPAVVRDRRGDADRSRDRHVRVGGGLNGD